MLLENTTDVFWDTTDRVNRTSSLLECKERQDNTRRDKK